MFTLSELEGSRAGPGLRKEGARRRASEYRNLLRLGNLLKTFFGGEDTELDVFDGIRALL